MCFSDQWRRLFAIIVLECNVFVGCLLVFCFAAGLAVDANGTDLYRVGCYLDGVSLRRVCVICVVAVAAGSPLILKH